jgi:hypothetical protein
MRLDHINLRNKYDALTKADLIVGHANKELPNAQVLSNLTDGYLFNTKGIVSTIKDIPLPNLAFNKLWSGDLTNRPTEIQTIGVNNMPNLTNGFFWSGDNNNRPIETKLPNFIDDAKFILQETHNALPNSQGLNELGGGILKTTALSNGVISIASGGGTPLLDDYVDPLTLQTNIAETKAFASAEAAAAEVAAVASSTAYFHYQMLPYVPSPIPLTGIGSQITGAIGAVGVVAASAKSTADEAISLIDNLEITLVGEVKGSGKIKNPIATKVGFSFFSKPDIPLNPHLGMLLFVEN